MGDAEDGRRTRRRPGGTRDYTNGSGRFVLSAPQVSLERTLTESGMPTRNRYSEDQESHSGSIAASTLEGVHEDITGESGTEMSGDENEPVEAIEENEAGTRDQEIAEENEEFGDEFDEFEEGAEDDFGDFDEAPVENMNEEHSLPTPAISHTQLLAQIELVSGVPGS